MSRTMELVLQYKTVFPPFMKANGNGGKTVALMQRVPPQTYNCGNMPWAIPFLAPQSVQVTSTEPQPLKPFRGSGGDARDFIATYEHMRGPKLRTAPQDVDYAHSYSPAPAVSYQPAHIRNCDSRSHFLSERLRYGPQTPVVPITQTLDRYEPPRKILRVEDTPMQLVTIDSYRASNLIHTPNSVYVPQPSLPPVRVPPPPEPLPPVQIPKPVPKWWERDLEKVMRAVFKYLSQREAGTAMLVCRARWIRTEKQLWESMDLGGNNQLDEAIMLHIGQRDPITLILGWTGLSSSELSRLFDRSRRLRHLSLAGCHWSCASALTRAPATLTQLDLRWVPATTDANFKRLVIASEVVRNLEDLFVSGCDITDATVRLISNQMKRLKVLDVGYCARLTDVSVQVLGAQGCAARRQMRQLTLTGCHNLTAASLDAALKMTSLALIDVRSISSISVESCTQFEEKVNAEGRDITVLK